MRRTAAIIGAGIPAALLLAGASWPLFLAASLLFLALIGRKG